MLLIYNIYMIRFKQFDVRKGNLNRIYVAVNINLYFDSYCKFVFKWNYRRLNFIAHFVYILK